MMQVTVKQLKSILEEEFLRGVPEFLFLEATTRYMIDIRNLVERYIKQSYGEGQQVNDVRNTLNTLLKELEPELNELVTDKLWHFTQQI